MKSVKHFQTVFEIIIITTLKTLKPLNIQGQYVVPEKLILLILDF